MIMPHVTNEKAVAFRICERAELFMDKRPRVGRDPETQECAIKIMGLEMHIGSMHPLPDDVAKALEKDCGVFCCPGETGPLPKDQEAHSVEPIVLLTLDQFLAMADCVSRSTRKLNTSSSRPGNRILRHDSRWKY